MTESEDTRARIPTLLLTAILALLGIRTFTSETPAPSSTGSKPSEERAVSGRRDDDNDSSHSFDHFWQPLLDYQAVQDGPTLAGPPDLDQGELRFLIACVPDPVESSSKYRFDGLVDAIQRAAETQGYVYDRSFYPWEKSNRKKPPKDGLGRSLAEQKSIRLQVGSASQGKSDSPSHQPGVLLLRNPSPRIRSCAGLIGLSSPPAGSWAAAAVAPMLSPRLLLVFLVGETATAGLDKKAFVAALQFISRSQEYKLSHCPRISVLGPHFSGSQTSLEIIVRAWGDQQKRQRRKPVFRVISGNATSIDKGKLERCCDSATVTFQATLVPDLDVIDGLLRYLNLVSGCGKSMKYKDSFAVLHESNTFFGQSVVRKPGLEQEQTVKGGGPTLFPFPLHVSEVRSAYSKSAGGSSNDIQRLPSFGSQLQLPTTEETRSYDVELSLDPAMTAVTSERLLAQMLETISHERFRYVFILATEVKDQLFLARLIRQQCPECRLVFPNSADLLFSHPDYSSYLRGSIVASSYPLCSRNQRWSFPFGGGERRLFFPGQGEQGYYNATIALLDSMPSKWLAEYGPPFPRLYPSVPENKPCTWISIIGQDGLYPLAVVPGQNACIDAERKNDYVFPGMPSNAQQTPQTQETQQFKATFTVSHPGLLTIPMLGMLLLLIYVGWAYLTVVLPYVVWKKAPERARGTVMQRLFWPRSPRLHKQQRFYTFVCLTSVLAAYSYLAFVWVLPLGHRLFVSETSPVEAHSWHWIMVAILIISPGIFVLGLCLRAFAPKFRANNEAAKSKQRVVAPPKKRQSLDHDKRPRSKSLRVFLGRWSFVALLVLLMGWMAIYLYWNGSPPRWWWDHPGECLLFAARASNLANGVTPVVPILLIGVAFFIWSCAQLRRLYLLGQHEVDNPCPANGDSLFQRIAKCHKEVTRRLLKPRLALESLGGVILWVLLFFTLSRLSSHFVPAAEGVLTEVPILLSLAVLAMLIVYGWLHLNKVWQSTDRLLSALALLPLQGAFGRLPLAVTSLFGHYLASRKPRSRDIENYQLKQRQELAAEFRCLTDELDAALLLTLDLRNALAADLPGDGPHTLTKSVQVCLQLLQHVYNTPRLAEQYLSKTLDESTISSDPTLRIHLWLRRAQEFVALEVMVYLSQFFVQVRNLAVSLSLLPLLMLIVVSSYPFQPQRLWLLLSMTLTVLVVLLVISIVVRVERNELISRIAGTTPHQLNFHWEFFSHLLLYALPLLGVLVAWSSDLSNLVHAWLDPLIQALK